jgi:hypothetical protein
LRFDNGAARNAVISPGATCRPTAFIPDGRMTSSLIAPESVRLKDAIIIADTLGLDVRRK